MSEAAALDRSALRRVLRRRAPWVVHPDLGPSAVSAGECDRCGHEARMVQPCGPPPDDLPGRATPDWALGRACADALGTEAWCDGHEDDARAALAWLAALPANADVIARLWWLATGEVRLEDGAHLVRIAGALVSGDGEAT